MHFQTFAAPAILQPYVKYFYVAEAPAMTAKESNSLRAIADGCPGLLLQAVPAGRFHQQGAALPGAFLFGPSTRYNDLQLEGGLQAIGAYLQPHAVHTLFGMPDAPLTDQCMNLFDMRQARSFRLAERLEDAPTAPARVQLLIDYLCSELQHNARSRQSMQYALSKIITARGSLLMPDLQRELQLSERSFERHFKQYTGISPKLFARICKFQASLKQLHGRQFRKLSDLAYENEYADQSHFIRAFKEFAGCTPQQYQQQGKELMENFTLF